MPMRSAQETLDATFLEMRWRCLSLAADLDRVERAPGGPELIASDSRLLKLREALQALLEAGAAADRAERVQLVFSDRTPQPSA